MSERNHRKESSMHDMESVLIEEMGLPLFVLALIYEIERCKNCRVAYDIKRNEIHINAPDPGEEGEEDALEKLDNLSNELDELNKLNEQSSKNYEVFKRGEDKGIDAIRIFKKKKHEENSYAKQET